VRITGGVVLRNPWLAVSCRHAIEVAARDIFARRRPLAACRLGKTGFQEPPNAGLTLEVAWRATALDCRIPGARTPETVFGRSLA